MKKLVLTILSLVILLSLAVGCSQQSEVEDQTSANAEPTAAKTETTEAETETTEAEKMVYEYTWLIKANADIFEYISGDMEVIQEIIKASGDTVKLNFDVVPSSDWDQKFNTVMAANDFPDMVYAKPTIGNLYGSQGAFAEISGLVEQYAPNFLKLATPINRYYNYAENGKLYTFFMSTPEKQDTNYFPIAYNQNLLEEMGEKEPKTLDEWVALWKKVKETYPEKIPFTLQVVNKVGQVTTRDLNALFGILNMDTDPGKMFYREGTEIKYWPTETRYKDLLVWLSMLYKEKLLDEEYITRQGPADVEKLILAEEAFSCIMDANRIGTWNDTLESQGIDTRIQMAEPPVGLYGNKNTYHWMSNAKTPNGGVAFNAEMEEDKLINIIKFMDYWVSDEGQHLMAWGPEGVYTEKGADGTLMFKEEYKTSDAQKEYLFQKGYINMAGRMGLAYSVDRYAALASIQGKNDDDPFWNKYWDIKANFEFLYGNNHEPAFTTEENDERVNLIVELYDNASKAFNEFVMGIHSLDTDWDSYVQNQKQLGADELLEIYKIADQRLQDYLANKK